MARVLYDGLVEYEDGTSATTSQMAKDVVEFLNWAAEPEMDQRKRMGVATIVITSVLLALSIWVKRLVITSLNALTETRLLTALPLGTSGRRSRQGRLFTTLLSLDPLGIVLLLDIRGCVSFWQRCGMKAIERTG